MSKIKIEALGGMQENGKNLYVVEVDEQIFILDAGLIYPEIDLYGIDAAIPNIDYLIENKNRVVGILVSHGHEDHIGAIPYLLKAINVKVFGTHFTISLIEELLELNGMDVKKYRLYRINDTKELTFGNVSVVFYNVNHSIPESAGIVLYTEDGAIVYAQDFNFAKSLSKKYKISYNRLLELNNKKVLAVMSESIGITDTIRASNDLVFDNEINNALYKTKGNMFVVCYSTDLSRIQKIVTAATNFGKKIAIIGRKGEQIVNMAVKTNYLEIPRNHLVKLGECDNENLVILIVGTNNEPYNIVERILDGKYKTIEFKDNDLIVGLSDPVTATKKYVLHVLDKLYIKDHKFFSIEKKNLRSSHATADDIVQLYSITNPKYAIPIKGEDRHLIKHVNVLKEIGYDDNIIDIADGNVAVFENGEFTGYEKINNGTLYVDGNLTGNVDKEIVEQRNTLATDGIVHILTYVDTKNQKIVKEPNIITKGFVNTKVGEEGIELIKTNVIKVVTASFAKRKTMDEFETAIENDIKRLIYRLTKKNPTVLPIVIDLKNIKY